MTRRRKWSDAVIIGQASDLSFSNAEMEGYSKLYEQRGCNASSDSLDVYVDYDGGIENANCSFSKSKPAGREPFPGEVGLFS